MLISPEISGRLIEGETALEVNMCRLQFSECKNQNRTRPQHQSIREYKAVVRKQKDNVCLAEIVYGRVPFNVTSKDSVLCSGVNPMQDIFSPSEADLG